MEEGAVTLLDVLGWKGIWQRLDDPVGILRNLVDDTGKRAERLVNRISKAGKSVPKSFSNLKVKVKGISDTIALFTYGECNAALEFHAWMAMDILFRSIQNEIPVRGATCYGSFTTRGNIMAGPAIDEVASWYEACEWIGVIQTPSALVRCKLDSFFDEDCLVRYNVATKMGPFKTLC